MSVQQHVQRPVRVSQVLAVVPPRPCGLGTCVGEIEIATQGSAAPLRVHLSDEQRNAIIFALGGDVPPRNESDGWEVTS